MVDISFVDFNVPIKDIQGGVYISFVDYDYNEYFMTTIDPTLYRDLPFMATNPYFNNFKNSREQELLNSLTVETIQIHGQDMWYIPRVINNKDEIYGSDDISTYEKAYYIEMFIRSVEGFGGDGNQLTKFGFEIRNTVILSVSKTRFEDEIGYAENMPRPKEGDLVYFPLNEKCFQVMYVDNKPSFYPLGSLPLYDLHCELFEYSNERFSTGIPEIDAIMQLSSDTLLYTLKDEAGNYIMDEDGNYIVQENMDIEISDPLADNDTVQDESDDFLDFSEQDPFSDGGRY
jgi:hypothetical protein